MGRLRKAARAEGPTRERPLFIIARAFSEAPQIFSVHGQNLHSKVYHGRNLNTGDLAIFPMEDALAIHEDADHARTCFAQLLRQIPAIDAAVYRAQRALQDAELARRRALREVAIGNALVRTIA